MDPHWRRLVRLQLVPPGPLDAERRGSEQRVARTLFRYSTQPRRGPIGLAAVALSATRPFVRESPSEETKPVPYLPFASARRSEARASTVSSACTSSRS